ncbi:MAG: hypothetical protein ACI4C1_10955 [Lachnospiraceae bacterium]
MEETIDEIWWRQIHSARSFIDSIVDGLLSYKSIILVMPGQIPWYEKMVELIETDTIRQNSRHSFDFVNDVQELPGRYLLNNYCKREKRAEYRPSMKYWEFFAERDELVLHSRYIWVSNLSEEKLAEWANFAAEYSRLMTHKHQRGAFILEVRDRNLTGKLYYRGIQTVSFINEITDYDKMTFSMLVAAKSSVRTGLKPYLAELASKIAKDDIELSARCSQKGRAFLMNPRKAIEEIIQKEVRSDGSDFIYQESNEMITRSIWETQIKLIFPVIETFRSEFIRKYEGQIQSQLPISTTYGECYSEPREVEIGTLCYMAVSRCINVTEKDYNRLVLLKEARNALAHLRVLTQTEVEEIIY